MSRDLATNFISVLLNNDWAAAELHNLETLCVLQQSPSLPEVDNGFVMPRSSEIPPNGAPAVSVGDLNGEPIVVGVSMLS